MPVAFGFSVGDFITGIVLVNDLIKALNDSTGSSAEYRGLISELHNLKRALELLQDLRIEVSQRAQRTALEQVAVQCQKTIEDFVKRTAKFELALGNAQSQPDAVLISKWRAGLKKAQWALNKKDEVSRVRAEIMGHTMTLNALMSTIHLGVDTLQNDRIEALQENNTKHLEQMASLQALARQNTEIFRESAILLRAQDRRLRQLEEESKETRSIVLKVLDTGKRIFGIVIDMQKLFWTFLPQQISHQQPVYLEDVLGRIAPFHIEWVNTREVSAQGSGRCVSYGFRG